MSNDQALPPATADQLKQLIKDCIVDQTKRDEWRDQPQETAKKNGFALSQLQLDKLAAIEERAYWVTDQIRTPPGNTVLDEQLAVTICAAARIVRWSAVVAAGAVAPPPPPATPC